MNKEEYKRVFKLQKVDYCNYCRKNTLHTIQSDEYNDEGTGGKLLCTVCGSCRMDKIQGFNANLM